MNPLAVFQAAELQAVTYSEAQPARVVNEHMIGTFQGRDADAEISVTRPEAAAQMLEQKKWGRTLSREEIALSRLP